MVTPRKRTSKGMNFEECIPTYFKGQDSNGSLRYGNNPGWNYTMDWEKMPAPKEGAWKSGNRSGE